MLSQVLTTHEQDRIDRREGGHYWSIFGFTLDSEVMI